MKGFSFGGGYRYQGANMMHWETDTNGNLSRIKGESTGYADGMLRYRTTMKMAGKDIKVSYQLNIQNLFDTDDPTIARYLRNDQANPADRLYYVRSRNFRLSATFDF